MSLILPWLILGDADDSSNEIALKKANVSYILNCTDNIKESFPKQFVYLNLPIEESNFYYISKHFKEAYEFIDQVEQVKKIEDSKPVRILVHCASGCTIAPIIIISYLMRSKGWDLTKAYDYVKDKRPSVNPNLGFVQQLSIFEQKLFKKVTKFGLEIRIFQFNDQFKSYKFKTLAIERSNLSSIKDENAIERIKQTVELYKEYFQESLVEYQEIEVDDENLIIQIKEVITNLKDTILICDKILKNF